MTKNPKDNELPENVVRGPWSKVKQPNIDALQAQENLAFANDLTQTLMVQMIHTMSENGIDVSEKSFVRDMGMIIELVKSTIYRDMGYEHVLQGLTDTFVDHTIEPDNTPTSEVNVETLDTFVNQFKDENDDPEIS